jgi:hypothetical protein
MKPKHSSIAPVRLFDNKPGSKGELVQVPLTEPLFATSLLQGLSFGCPSPEGLAKGVLLKVPNKPRGKRDGYIDLTDLTDKKPRGIWHSWFCNDDVVPASQIPLNFRVTRKGRVIDGVTATEPFSIDIAEKLPQSYITKN